MSTANTVPGDPPPVIVNEAPAPADLRGNAPQRVDGAPGGQTEAEDEFSSMFASFAKNDAPDPAGSAPAAPGGQTGAPQAAQEPPGGQEPAPTPGGQEPAPTPVPDAVERLADILAQRQQQAPPPPPQPAPQPAYQQPIYSPEEATALQEFYKEWPDVAKAQELAIRGAIHQTTNHIFTEVARVLGPRLQLLEALANNAQYDALERRVPDYSTVTDKVAAWVEQQPAYLRAAYTGVMSEGTPDEVEDLIGRYRQATGDKAPANSAPASQPAPSSVSAPPVLSPAAKQAASRLAPVSGKRTGPTQGTATTFDDAFAEFARSA